MPRYKHQVIAVEQPRHRSQTSIRAVIYDSVVDNWTNTIIYSTSRNADISNTGFVGTAYLTLPIPD